jgi:hypothetical protein
VIFVHAQTVQGSDVVHKTYRGKVVMVGVNVEVDVDVETIHCSATLDFGNHSAAGTGEPSIGYRRI